MTTTIVRWQAACDCGWLSDTYDHEITAVQAGTLHTERRHSIPPITVFRISEGRPQ